MMIIVIDNLRNPQILTNLISKDRIYYLSILLRSKRDVFAFGGYIVRDQS